MTSFDIETNHGQVAQDIRNQFLGNVKIEVPYAPCPGPHACPHKSESWQHETDLQTEFAEKVGIWCPRPARQIIGPLIGEFTPRELRIAWNANSIFWSTRSNEIRVSTPWIEAAFGWGFVLLGSALFAILLIWSIGNSPGNLGFATASLAGALLYLGCCWFAGRFMLWPRRIAIRVRNRLVKDTELKS